MNIKFHCLKKFNILVADVFFLTIQAYELDIVVYLIWKRMINYSHAANFISAFALTGD